MDRAYSLITVKDFDPDKRTFSGIATSPVPDRVGDIIEPSGVTFKNPLPLLLYHDSHRPVGETSFGRNTKDGTPFTARISTIDRTSGIVKERLDEAVDSLAAKPPLIRGVSIGFRPLEDPIYIKETGGFRFPKVEVLELSMVVIPAHQDATIANVKSLDTESRRSAQSGTDRRLHSSHSPAAVGSSRKKDSHMAIPISDQVSAAQAELRTASARLDELDELEGAEGGLDDAQVTEQKSLTNKVSSLADKVERLKAKEKASLALARPVLVKANDGDVRDVSSRRTEVTNPTPPKLEKGIAFARMVMCKMASLRTGIPAYQIAKREYPNYQDIELALKEDVPAASTRDNVWAGSLVYAQNLTSEFIEFLRPQTIIGRIDSFTRVPFNTRVNGQTSGASGYWVGEGRAKPLTMFNTAATTLGFYKVANIIAITQELARFSSPSAETLVRKELARACQERIDRDFIDPNKAAVAGISPASITNGIANINSAGSSLANVDTDVNAIMTAFAQNYVMPTHWIMPNQTALSLSLMRTSLGARAFPDITMNGGTFMGLPVITSQYAVHGTPLNNWLILISAPDIFLADDGDFTIDVSREASLEMNDAPTMSSGPLGSPVGATGSVVVSMFQTNSVAVRCERFINWARARSTAVQWIDDANYVPS